MKAVARHWLNYNGRWYAAGEEFEAESIEEVREYADPIADAPQVLAADMKPAAKRGRPKKTGE